MLNIPHYCELEEGLYQRPNSTGIENIGVTPSQITLQPYNFQPQVRARQISASANPP